ncbi:MAG: SDR family NAD(P)-dependent oxidoreductase [Rhodobacteraceae bacterium]|nr:SDR family NAD(P)-dependent oxidoreductase [Paracoccaceae bacterium]
MQKIALVTGASSGFGRMIATDLARAGHIAYASMRDIAGRNAGAAAETRARAKADRIDLRPIEMDVQEVAGIEATVAQIIATHGRLDVLVQKCWPHGLGPLGGVHARGPRRALRCQCAGHPAGEPRGAAAYARGPRRPDRLDLVEQRRRWHPAAARPLFRRQGGHGPVGGELCARACPARDRDRPRGPGRLCQGHQSLRTCRRASGCGADGGLCPRLAPGVFRRAAKGAGRDRSARVSPR